MFADKFVSSFRKVRRSRPNRVDIVGEQVKKMLTDSDQKLILMVRS